MADRNLTKLSEIAGIISAIIALIALYFTVYQNEGNTNHKEVTVNTNKDKKIVNSYYKSKDFYKIIYVSEPAKKNFDALCLEDINNGRLDKIEIPLKQSNFYKPSVWYDSSDIENGVANHLIGKVVFAEPVSPRVAANFSNGLIFGTLLCFRKDNPSKGWARLYYNYGTRDTDIRCNAATPLLRISEAIVNE